MKTPFLLIAENSLFKTLPKETLEGLSQTAIQRSYKPRETIVNQEDVWPYLFLMAEGEVSALKESQEGRAFIATTLEPGDIFWGLAFFIENAGMPVSLQSNTESAIFLWHREYLVPLIWENGSMAWNLCRIMISRMQLASVIVDELAFQPVMSRLAGLLLEIFGNAEDEFKARELTLEEMAARIGTTREMVCRHMYRFAEKGAIEIRRTELRITDRSLLEKKAGKE